MITENCFKKGLLFCGETENLFLVSRAAGVRNLADEPQTFSNRR